MDADCGCALRSGMFLEREHSFSRPRSDDREDGARVIRKSGKRVEMAGEYDCQFHWRARRTGRGNLSEVYDCTRAGKTPYSKQCAASSLAQTWRGHAGHLRWPRIEQRAKGDFTRCGAMRQSKRGWLAAGFYRQDTGKNTKSAYSGTVRALGKFLGGMDRQRWLEHPAGPTAKLKWDSSTCGWIREHLGQIGDPPTPGGWIFPSLYQQWCERNGKHCEKRVITRTRHHNVCCKRVVAAAEHAGRAVDSIWRPAS